MQKYSLQKILEFSSELKKTDEFVFSNYYNQFSSNIEILFDCVKTNFTVCFGYNDNNVYRILFFSINKDDLSNCIFQYKNIAKDIIVEIIYTNENDENRKLFNDFENSKILKKIDSFKRYKVDLKSKLFLENLGDQFFKNYRKNSFELAKIEDIKQIQNIFASKFDKRVSHLPTDIQLESYIKNNQVFIIRQNNEIKTFWIYEIQGKKIYSYQAFNSIQSVFFHSIWYESFYKFSDEGFNQVYAWISDKNFFSLNLHKRFNFVFDRLNLEVFCLNH